jgi:formylglycine-generating enzyme required for sulfatase activity
MQNFPIILPDYPDKVFNELIFVEGGEFMIGDKVEVKLSNFWISKYQVTQDLYEAVMGKDKNLSRFKGARRPVENVSWLDAVQFCNKLSEMMGRAQVYDIQNVESEKFKQGIAIPDLTKNGICLPPEAAWEYAARGGKYHSPYRYAGSDYLEEVAWYDENSHIESKPVGLKLPNALGLYDMSGNVWEWCEDDYDSSFYETIKNNHENPINITHRSTENSSRVLHGGSWSSFAFDCRVSYRYGDHFDFRDGYFFGFRLFVRVS